MKRTSSSSASAKTTAQRTAPGFPLTALLRPPVTTTTSKPLPARTRSGLMNTCRRRQRTPRHAPRTGPRTNLGTPSARLSRTRTPACGWLWQAPWWTKTGAKKPRSLSRPACPPNPTWSDRAPKMTTPRRSTGIPSKAASGGTRRNHGVSRSFAGRRRHLRRHLRRPRRQAQRHHQRPLQRQPPQRLR